MTESQEKILSLSRETDITELSLREIGKRVGLKHPQTVKDNISKLRELGLLERAKRKDFFKEVREVKVKDSRLYKVPILGYANCGIATSIAEEDFQGYLRLSNSILQKRPNMFALIASGDSMDKANIDDESIDDGDYIIVNGDLRNPKNGDYIVSVIDGSANIKKFQKDEERKMIILLSESTTVHDPIYIHEDDFSSYFVNGKVVKVVKKPSIE